MRNAEPTRQFILHLSSLILFFLLLACTPIPTFVPAPTAVPPVILSTATLSANPPSPVQTPISAQVAPVETLVPNPTADIRNLPLPKGQDPETQKLLPTRVAEVNLGVRLEQSFLHPVALDLDAGHIFVATRSTQTLVLSADDLRRVNSLPAGGDLAIDRARGRLYMGEPNGLAVFDTDSLVQTMGIPSLGGSAGGTPVVDEGMGDVFVVRNGVYTIDSLTWNTSGRIAGTFAVSGSTPSSAYAVDAAFDAQRRLLHVSLNNGIPGSNNGNTLLIYNVRTDEVVYRDDERSIVSLAVEADSGRVLVARSRLNNTSLTALTADRNQIKAEWRINGIAGAIQVDARRGRVYVSESRASSRLLVLDAATGALIADVPLPRAYVLVAFDDETDQLYLLSPDGYMMVMHGHGGPVSPPEALQTSNPLTGTLAWMAASPDFSRSPSAGRVLAVWTPGRSSVGPAGALAGQLMLSADAGSTWQPAGNGLPAHLLVNAAAFSPDFVRDRTLFVSALTLDGRGGGVYVSSDAGQSWHPATRGLGDWIVAELAVAPGFPFNRTVFALTSSELYRSTDGGVTWQRTPCPIGAPVAMNARTLAVSPEFVNDHTLVVSTSERALVSRDGGESWWPLIENRATFMAFASDQVLLGNFADAGVLRSNDGGTRWQATSYGLRFDAGSRVALALSPHFVRDQTAVALIRTADQSSLYRTINGGAEWQIESSGWMSKTQITAATFAPDGSLFVGTSDGQVRPVKAEERKWTSVPVALDKLDVEAIALSPDYALDRTVFIGSARVGVFASSDGGKRWSEMSLPARSPGNSKLLLALSPGFTNDRVVFASAAGQTFRSDDGGASWQSLTNGLGNFFPVSSLAVSPQFGADRTGLIGGGPRAARVMRSADGGETWSATSGLGQNSGVTAFAFVPGSSRIVYAWAQQSGLYRSSDTGVTWTRVFSLTVQANMTLQSFAISPNFARDRLMFAGVLGQQNLRRSADGGTAWYPSDSGLPLNLAWGSALAVSPNFASDRLIFLGTDKGVFRSEEGGATWKASSVSLPLTGAGVLSLAISPNFAQDRTLFVGLAERGLYVSTDAGATWKPAR